MLLAANESLVAYRRSTAATSSSGAGARAAAARRRQPAWAFVGMRSAAEHVADGRVEGTVAIVATVSGRASVDELASGAAGHRRLEPSAAFARGVVDTWFATPVNPMMMRARRATACRSS